MLGERCPLRGDVLALLLLLPGLGAALRPRLARLRQQLQPAALSSRRPQDSEAPPPQTPLVTLGGLRPPRHPLYEPPAPVGWLVGLVSWLVSWVNG